MSPRLALGGTLISARAMALALNTGCERHDDLHAVRPERAIAHLRNDHDFLSVGEADAGGDSGAPGARPEMKHGHLRLRVLFIENVDGLDVIGFSHRALDRDRERNSIAVLDNRRKVELDPAVLRFSFAHHLADG